MMRRKAIQLTSKPGSVIGLGRVQTLPVYGLINVRRGGGVNPIQALVRNVGTCQPDGKGEIGTGSPPEGEEYQCGVQGRSSS
jgi:hypothetical protein